MTTLATALGVAVLAGPGAEAAKPTPPPDTAQLQILEVLDDGFTLPTKAAATLGTQEGLIRPGLPFNVTVESQTLDGDPLVVTNGDLKVTLSGGGVNAVLTIEKGESTGTLSLERNGTSNFVLTAAGPKNAGYASDSIPVHVALESAHSPNGLAAGQTLTVKDADGNPCVLSAENPTCVSLSVAGADVAGSVVLTTSECAGFFTKTGDPLDCTTKKGKSTLVAQTLVDLDPTLNQVATATLYCDKSLCGNGGVSQFIPLVDVANTGEFEPAPECPEKGVLGVDQNICVDLRASSRFGAGDLATVILFDFDVRMSH